jgi:hypothetical protein
MVRLEERDRCWLLLPSQQWWHPVGCIKQKIGCRGETRQYGKPVERGGWIYLYPTFCLQTVSDTNTKMDSQ